MEENGRWEGIKFWVRNWKVKLRVERLKSSFYLWSVCDLCLWVDLLWVILGEKGWKRVKYKLCIEGVENPNLCIWNLVWWSCWESIWVWEVGWDGDYKSCYCGGWKSTSISTWKIETQPMGIKKMIHLQKDTYSSLWWENSNSKCLMVEEWEHMLLCTKFMEFLPTKRKKDYVFFLSYVSP